MRINTALAFSAFILFFSNSVSAATLDAPAIKNIHLSVKEKMTEKCKKDRPKATNDECVCLATKTESALNDSALAKCASDVSGQSCIATEVTAAGLKGFAQDNIKSCTTTTDVIEPVEINETTPAAATTPTTNNTVVPAITTETPPADTSETTTDSSTDSGDSGGGDAE